MDKISGILPSNKRIESVDLKNSSPVRSGVPNFGQNVVKPSNHRALAKTTLDEASWTYNKVQEGKEKMRSEAQRVQDIADRFFDKKTIDEGGVIGDQAKAPFLKGANAAEVDVAKVVEPHRGQNLAIKA